MILSLTAVIDHELVDGGPAARFGARLQELVESADDLERERRDALEAGAPAS